MNDETKRVDPGWNDPPMLNFSAAQPPPKSRIGNKRVPFPLGSSSSSAQNPVLSVNPVQPNNDTSDEVVPNMINLTFNNFRSVLDSQINNEILEKIKLMEEMWKKGQFPINLRNDLYKLSDYIVKKDHENANKLNLELHMKYSNYCKEWIVAVGFLIHGK